LIVAKSDYGDFFEFHRRRQPMSIASELAWQLLPPLTFGSDRVVISGALAPAYDLGGDSFDYGVDADIARIAVFDAMGHGLEPGDQVVFFTDGVIEARSPDGNFFGADRLADLVGRATAGGNLPPETLRRLVHSILDHQAGDLQDDATAVLVEWKGQGKESLEV